MYVADKTNTKDGVLDHRCAPTAKVLTHLPLQIAQPGRRRKKFNVYALTKRIPFPEARRLVEASLPSVLPTTGALSYSHVVSRTDVQSVRVSEIQFQLSLFLTGLERLRLAHRLPAGHSPHCLCKVSGRSVSWRCRNRFRYFSHFLFCLSSVS